MRCKDLFVYGTLRKGGRTNAGRMLTTEAEFLSDARFRGRLFLVNDYAGAISSKDPADIVIGELYRMEKPESLLDLLDEYEGCGRHSPPPQEFIRKIMTVYLPDGSALPAWIYLYNRAVTRCERIHSGDFLESQDARNILYGRERRDRLDEQ